MPLALKSRDVYRRNDRHFKDTPLRPTARTNVEWPEERMTSTGSDKYKNLDMALQALNEGPRADRDDWLQALLESAYARMVLEQANRDEVEVLAR